MQFNKNHMIDSVTGLPNFIRFFTDDFSDVYGESGTLLLFKIKPMTDINHLHGREVGDRLLALVGSYLNSAVSELAYKHEGNAFLIVYKNHCEAKAKAFIVELEKFITQAFLDEGVKCAHLYTFIMKYDSPIRSVADYYTLFYDVVLKEHNLRDERALLHHILDRLSYRVNDMIGKYSEVREYALHDEISGLENSKSAHMLFEEIDKNEANYAILFIDGDNLSRFNQISYDHGNQAIRSIAEVIRSSIRKTDKVFRWLSGDEFVVVATDTTYDEVGHLAERIRLDVENAFKNHEIPATISIGISMYPHNADNIHSVVSTAELANKMAKKQGKNMCVFYAN